ncbi:MAG TPA: exodeoxyribonuclease VII small subunit [Acidimicrobiales bacterium]|nr:exodeoxyribonuclease VII small subunit [Acidimicrobiales bacterium]
MTAPTPSRELAPVGDLGYTEAAEELDRIINELDRGVVDIDVLEDRLSRAVEIVEELDRRIKGARQRVNTILPRLEAAGPRDDPGATTV